MKSKESSRIKIVKSRMEKENQLHSYGEKIILTITAITRLLIKMTVFLIKDSREKTEEIFDSNMCC